MWCHVRITSVLRNSDIFFWAIFLHVIFSLGIEHDPSSNCNSPSFSSFINAVRADRSVSLTDSQNRSLSLNHLLNKSFLSLRSRYATRWKYSSYANSTDLWPDDTRPALSRPSRDPFGLRIHFLTIFQHFQNNVLTLCQPKSHKRYISEIFKCALVKMRHLCVYKINN